MSATKTGKMVVVSTTLVNTVVKKIGGNTQTRELAVISNETTAKFFYAFGDSTSVIGDFTAATMLPLRADTDLYWSDSIPQGPLFVLQSSGGNLVIKTVL